MANRTSDELIAFDASAPLPICLKLQKATAEQADNYIVLEHWRKASADVVAELIPFTISKRADANLLKDFQNVGLAALLAVTGAVRISILKAQAAPYIRAAVFYWPKPV